MLMLVYCMNLKEIGKVLTSKSVGTGPSSYEERIYRAAVSQRLRNTALYYVYERSGLQVKHGLDEGCQSQLRYLMYTSKK
jgi:hypothetical protein